MVLVPAERTTHMTTALKKPRRMARPAPVDGNAAASLPASTVAPVKRTTKRDLVLTLLQAEGGTSLGAIIEATGWLPHTARAALTGLRKKGHAIVRTKVEDETRYAVTATAAQ